MITLFNKKQECCGCTACESICPKQAISMQSDEEGFLYPVIDTDKCIECKKCLSVCALKHSGIKTIEDFPKIYACKHKSDVVRRKSTSGGLFTAVSDFVLQHGGVVYGAAHNSDVETVHIRAKTTIERDRCRGAKYVQSDLKDTYKKIGQDLYDGKHVLFTGTPCQVDGLLMYINKANVCVDKLLTADVICHGVPSPKIFNDFIKFCNEKSGKNVLDFLHRQKESINWPGEEKIIFSNGSYLIRSKLSSIWSKLFYSVIIQRPVCSVCKYAQPTRCSDITMADYWGIENSMPDFYDALGVSLSLVNSEKGQKLIEAVRGNLDIRESCIDDCMPYQGNLRRPSIVNPKREEFWKIYQQKGFEDVAVKYGGYNLQQAVRLFAINVFDKIGLLKTARQVKWYFQKVFR